MTITDPFIPKVRRAALALAGGSLAGCSPSPSIGVLGAYFPDWLFCITGAVLLTIVLHAVIQRLGREDFLAYPAVSYPALVAILALGGWLLVFHP